MKKYHCIHRDFASAEPRIFILILSHILYREMKELLPAIARLGPGICQAVEKMAPWCQADKVRKHMKEQQVET